MEKKPLINTVQVVNLGHVAIYCGVGAQAERLIRSLLQELVPSCHIIIAGPENMAEVLVSCQCFIMPGGADLPYCAVLDGSGNRLIREFVTVGGTYLGICAGAYYAARRIEFHKSRPDQICGDRELGFFPGTAVGSLAELGSFYDGTPATALAVEISLPDGSAFNAYYHGGCAFMPDEDARFQVLARYVTLPGQPAACVQMPVGGGQAILCGMHPEAGPSLLERPDADERYRSMLETLDATEAKRRQFWRGLLIQCGIDVA